MQSHFKARFYKTWILMAALCAMLRGSAIHAWTESTSPTTNLTELSESESWFSRFFSLKNFSIDVDLKPHFGGMLLSNQPSYVQGPLDRIDSKTSSMLFRDPLYNEAMPSTQPFLGSFMRLSAHYDRAQCFVSLGRMNQDPLPFFPFSPSSSYLSTGIGIRYQWNDYLAFEFGTMIHLTNARRKVLDDGAAKTTEPMSDFTNQVNNLSAPIKNSFAEGLFTIVYYFCNPK